MALDDPSILIKDISLKNPARSDHKTADMASIESQEDLPNLPARAAYPGDIPAGVMGLCYGFRIVQQAVRNFRDAVGAFYCAFMMPVLDDDDSDCDSEEYRQ